MLTIFTPTYNRATTILRTYKSLVTQTCKNFEWLIVDDGSIDDTESLVCSWVKKSEFPIRYIKQTNGGKYRAYNNALKNAIGEFFFCLDSDDWLPENAVEVILTYAEKLRENESLAGIVALKMFQDESVIGFPFNKTDYSSSLYDLELSGEGGERSLVFKTSVAQQFPFPENTQEKFIGESIIYDRYHGQYKFIVSNAILTTCEYQPDGLSSNNHMLMYKNPAGYKLYFAQRIDMTPSFIERISYILRYHAFRNMYDGSAYNYNGKHKLLVTLLSPLGVLIKLCYLIRK